MQSIFQNLEFMTIFHQTSYFQITNVGVHLNLIGISLLFHTRATIRQLTPPKLQYNSYEKTKESFYVLQ